jgi:imidazolonepropionase-like amidohydrolase
MPKLRDAKCWTAVLVLVGAGLASAAQIVSAPDLAIAHVTVVDVEHGGLRRDQTVIIRGNRIVAIEPGRATQTDLSATRIIDGRGKYLIPGLWDMHTHGGFSPEIFALHGANGVTGIRHMGGPLDEAADFRRRERAGLGAYPMRIRVGALPGPALDAFEQYPQFPGLSVLVRAPAEGRRAVDNLHAAGMDFIKIHTQMSRATWLAVVDRAKKLGMAFAGHVPYSVSPVEASDAGQKSIEHLTGVAIACSSEEEDIRRAIAAVAPGPDATAPRVEHHASPRVLATFSAHKCAALADRFARQHTWQVPTFVAIDPDRCCKRAGDDPRARFLAAPIREWWESAAGTPLANDDLSVQRRMFQKRLDIVGMFHRHGVPLLAGTDMGVPWVYPGFSLHDELTALVRAGLSPAEALRTATVNPARYWNRAHELGEIGTGKLADLVLLDANPLADIGSTRKIRAVILDGQLFDRDRIDEILNEVSRRLRQSHR